MLLKQNSQYSKVRTRFQVLTMFTTHHTVVQFCCKSSVSLLLFIICVRNQFSSLVTAAENSFSDLWLWWGARNQLLWFVTVEVYTHIYNTHSISSLFSTLSTVQCFTINQPSLIQSRKPRDWEGEFHDMWQRRPWSFVRNVIVQAFHSALEGKTGQK